MNPLLLLLLVGTSPVSVQGFRGIALRPPFYGIVRHARSDPVAMKVAEDQVNALVNGVKRGDGATVLALFEAIEKDKKALDSFMKNYGTITITVTTAQKKSSGEIVAEMLFEGKNGRHAKVVWVMEKNSQSSTGWKVTSVATGKVEDKISRHNFDGGIWDTIQLGTCVFNLLSCLDLIPVDIFHYEPTGTEVIFA